MNSDRYIKINNEYFDVGFMLKEMLINLIDAGINDETLAKIYNILLWHSDLETGKFIYRVTKINIIKNLLSDSTIENIFIDNKATETNLLKII